MHFGRMLLKLFALVGILLLSVNCGQSESAKSESSYAQDSVSRGDGQDENGEQSGIFRRLWIDPPTLDPHLITDTSAAGLGVEIFGGLVTITTDLQLKPDLAERWEISKDGTVYTFFLRENAKFHDGKPVTAADVQYSLERAADPRTGSPVADTYLGDIVGVRDKLSGKAESVRGIKVIDDRTIQITIDGSKAYFAAKLTYPTAFVVDRENIEELGRNWTRNPNGTGPFKLSSYRIGELLVLERNDLYHLGPAMVQRVENILSGGSSMAMYENDEIHITGVGLADTDRVTNPEEPLNKELTRSPPGFDISYVGLNTAIPPFDDPKVRQALNHAIDKDLIADQVLANQVVPAYGILPPGFPGYTGEIRGLGYDPDLAKLLLAESRYANDIPRIILTIPGTGGSPGLDLEVIIEQWRQVLEIDVEIEQVEWATFLQDMRSKKLQAYAGLGWQADYPDPEDFLDVLFHSQSALNDTSYSNPELDALLEKARLTDWEERVRLYQKAEQLIIDEAAWVPLWFSGEGMVLIKPYVTGYKLTPMIVPKLRHISVDR